MGDDKREQRKLSNISREELVFARFFKRLVARSNASPRVPSLFCTSHEMRFTALPRRKKEKKKEKSSNERSRWR